MCKYTLYTHDALAVPELSPSDLPAESALDAVDRDFWDRVGMSLSGICVVHCLALPVAVSVLPMWTSVLDVHKWLHPLFAVLLIPTTLIAGLAGYRRHSSKLVVGLLSLGLLIVLATGVIFHEELGTTKEILFTSIGSVVLIAGHLLNWRRRHNQC